VLAAWSFAPEDRVAQPVRCPPARFLRTINHNVPVELDVHLGLDNASCHKTPTVRRRLAQHPRFVLQFTSTSSS